MTHILFLVVKLSGLWGMSQCGSLVSGDFSLTVLNWKYSTETRESSLMTLFMSPDQSELQKLG